MSQITPQTVYHLAAPEDADNLANQGVYAAPSLASEGFIHCAGASQLPGVIQRYYASAEDLVLLQIDADQLGEKLVMENTVGGTELFPHIYGEIPAAAIITLKPLDANALQSIATSKSYTADN